MASITVSKPGLVVTAAAQFTPTGGGAVDTVINDGRTFIIIDCGATPGATSVTFDSKAACDQGSDHNIVYSCVANEKMRIGPFQKSRFNNQSGQLEIAVAGTVNTLRLEAISYV